MATNPVWACGCGTSVAGSRCPRCGWSQSAAGQPERGPQRWAPLVAGLVTMSLAVGATTAAVGVDDRAGVRFEQVGEVVPTADGALAGVPNRPLPPDLAGVLPAAVAGWEPVEVPGLSGTLDLTRAAELGQEGSAAQGFERRRLERAGFVRGHSAVFVHRDLDLVAGAALYELGSAAAAQDYLDTQAAVAAADRSVERVDVPFIVGALAWSYDTEDGGQGIDVLYRVDQLVVREYLAATGVVDLQHLQDIHSAITEGLAA